MLKAILHQLPGQISEAAADPPPKRGNAWCVSRLECTRGIKAHDSVLRLRRPEGNQQGELLPSRSFSPDPSKMG